MLSQNRSIYRDSRNQNAMLGDYRTITHKPDRTTCHLARTTEPKTACPPQINQLLLYTLITAMDKAVLASKTHVHINKLPTESRTRGFIKINSGLANCTMTSCCNHGYKLNLNLHNLAILNEITFHSGSCASRLVKLKSTFSDTDRPVL